MSENKARRALAASVNKHWFGRMVIACWALHLPFVTFLSPESISARGIAGGGLYAFVLMTALAVVGALALVDSTINDVMPARFVSALMYHRHIGFMGMAILLVMLGGCISIETGNRSILAAYLTPAVFAFAVTWLDLHQKRGLR